MSDQLFQIPSEVSKIVTMQHRSLRLSIDTQEALTDEMMAKAMGLMDKRGYFTFSVEPIQPDALLNLPPLTYEKEEKTPAQRLRNTLFVYWTQKNKPTETFDEFYRQSIEKIVNSIKQKLV